MEINQIYRTFKPAPQTPRAPQQRSYGGIGNYSPFFFPS